MKQITFVFFLFLPLFNLFCTGFCFGEFIGRHTLNTFLEKKTVFRTEQELVKYLDSLENKKILQTQPEKQWPDVKYWEDVFEKWGKINDTTFLKYRNYLRKETTVSFRYTDKLTEFLQNSEEIFIIEGISLDHLNPLLQKKNLHKISTLFLLNELLPSKKMIDFKMTDTGLVERVSLPNLMNWPGLKSISFDLKDTEGVGVEVPVEFKKWKIQLTLEYLPNNKNAKIFNTSIPIYLEEPQVYELQSLYNRLSEQAYFSYILFPYPYRDYQELEYSKQALWFRHLDQWAYELGFRKIKVSHLLDTKSSVFFNRIGYIYSEQDGSFTRDLHHDSFESEERFFAGLLGFYFDEVVIEKSA